MRNFSTAKAASATNNSEAEQKTAGETPLLWLLHNISISIRIHNKTLKKKTQQQEKKALENITIAIQSRNTKPIGTKYEHKTGGGRGGEKGRRKLRERRLRLRPDATA